MRRAPGRAASGLLATLLLSASPTAQSRGLTHTSQLAAVYDAILDALLNGGLLGDEAMERLMGDPADADGRSQLEQLIDKLIEGLAREGYITVQPDLEAAGLGPDGLRYRSSELGAFQAGKRLEVKVRYSKTDPRTSLEIVKPENPQPPVAPSAGRMPFCSSTAPPTWQAISLPCSP